MTISVTRYIEGDEIGILVKDAPEDIWYMLLVLAQSTDEEFAREVADYANFSDRDEVIQFLQNLTDAIKNTE